MSIQRIEKVGGKSYIERMIVKWISESVLIQDPVSSINATSACIQWRTYIVYKCLYDYLCVYLYHDIFKYFTPFIEL